MFTSTSSSFFVTLYNLNYNIPIESPDSIQKQDLENEKTGLSGENQDNLHFDSGHSDNCQDYHLFVSSLKISKKLKNRIIELYK